MAVGEAIILGASLFLTGMVTATLVLRYLPRATERAPAPEPPPQPAWLPPPVAVPPPAPAASPSPPPVRIASRAPTFDMLDAARLPNFSKVGGLDALKQEMLDTVGLVVRHPDRAREYRIAWNGVLLHGPPGVGKSFFARALAGELGLNLLPVATSDLVTGRLGAGAAQVEALFEFAATGLPCMLLFDEFDTVAAARGDSGDRHGAEILTQLLRSLEDCHGEPRLVVVATTNDVDNLDPAVTRPGRFDRIVRMDLPDEEARKAIFAAALTGRPVHPDIDLDSLADRTQAMTPAAIVHAVDAAALAACREAAGTASVVRISVAHIEYALAHRGGQDRPTVEHWSWSRLVLPEHTLAELKEVQTLLSEPDQAAELGVDAPSGILMTGPPGTGKTTIAKVMAAESSCSFYPVSAADITSRWVGESEQKVARLFNRARSNAPSIIFIDEIDAIGSIRGELSSYDRQLNQLLEEIDGLGSQPGVLVIGATNRPQALDPALVRGGRLTRRIDIPLPDHGARRAMLKHLTARMPLSGVNVNRLATETEGFSGGDLKALCQQAALEAMIRQHGTVTAAAVTARDFDVALASHEDANGSPLS